MAWLKRQLRIRRIFLFLPLALLAVGSIISCNDMFYYPDQHPYRKLCDVCKQGEDVSFASLDGTKLHGWLLRSETEPAKGTVIHFHGNAQNLTSHCSFVDWLPARGYNVFCFDYRGYGQSEGSPSQDGLHQDGIAALRHARTLRGVEPDKLLVFGQSLGGAVALAVLGESEKEGVRAVVIDSSFASYRDVANCKLGGTFLTYPLAWLLVRDGHAPIHSLANIAPVPLLIFHGDCDGVVPFEQGKAIYEAASEPKKLITITGGTHTSAMRDEKYRQKVTDFFDRCLGDFQESAECASLLNGETPTSRHLDGF